MMTTADLELLLVVLASIVATHSEATGPRLKRKQLDGLARRIRRVLEIRRTKRAPVSKGRKRRWPGWVKSGEES